MSRIRLSALLTIFGLAALTVSLFRPHAYSFLLFTLVGVPAIIAGAVLFALRPRQKKT